MANTQQTQHKQETDTQPPQPPETKKKLQFTKSQLIGMPFILLVPILALFGLFGETIGRIPMASSDLQVTVEYPTKYRYKQIQPMEIFVHNISTSQIQTVTVSVDTGYLLSFSNVTFTPSVDEVTAEAHIVHLTDVKPGENRLVSVELQAEQYWQHRGTVAVQANGEPLMAEIRTFIFP
jgi:hypothetical protein